MTEAALTQTKTESGGKEAVFRLIYRSRCLVPASETGTELGKILRVARANNSAKHITGALLMYQNWFAQTLEGEEAEVRALYARIERDKRHDTIAVLEQGASPSRLFAKWSMALVAEHGESDIPLAATASGVTPAASRPTTADQEHVLDVMRSATRGYGMGS